MPHVEADLGAATSKVEFFVIIEIVILTIIKRAPPWMLQQSYISSAKSVFLGNFNEYIYGWF